MTRSERILQEMGPKKIVSPSKEKGKDGMLGLVCFVVGMLPEVGTVRPHCGGGDVRKEKGGVCSPY